MLLGVYSLIMGFWVGYCMFGLWMFLLTFITVEWGTNSWSACSWGLLKEVSCRTRELYNGLDGGDRKNSFRFDLLWEEVVAGV